MPLSNSFTQPITTVSLSPKGLNLNKPLLQSVIVLCITAYSLFIETFATTLQFIDQNGTPIQNVVVTLPIEYSGTKTTFPKTIDQVNMQFSPRVLTIQKGEHVVFPNSDNIRHHLYSFSKAKTLEIKMNSERKVAPLEFDTPGIVAIGCNIHDDMLGFIYVADGQETLVSDQNGIVVFNAPVSYVDLWHEKQFLQINKQHRVDIPTKEDWHTIQLILQRLEKIKPESSLGFKSKFRHGG